MGRGVAPGVALGDAPVALGGDIVIELSNGVREHSGGDITKIYGGDVVRARRDCGIFGGWRWMVGAGVRETMCG
jgi:hypothetical protein